MTAGAVGFCIDGIGADGLDHSTKPDSLRPTWRTCAACSPMEKVAVEDADATLAEP